jgi:hypothetical protein
MKTTVVRAVRCIRHHTAEDPPNGWQVEVNGARRTGLYMRRGNAENAAYRIAQQQIAEAGHLPVLVVVEGLHGETVSAVNLCSGWHVLEGDGIPLQTGGRKGNDR